MRIHNLLQVFVKLFRFTELCVALFFFFWAFSRLPLVVRISSDYITQFSGFFASPVFGFVLCNTIVVTLIVNPNRFSGDPLIFETELLKELIINGGDNNSLSLSGNGPNGRLSSEPEPEPGEIEYEDKEVISEVSQASTIAAFTGKMVSGMDSEMGGKKLRRWKTEEEERVRRGENWAESVCYRDELSNREFEQRIDAFIARELRFRREESVGVVLRSESCL